MAKEGVLPGVVDMFGPTGQRQLDAMALGESYTVRAESLRDLIEVYDREIVIARAAHPLSCSPKRSRRPTTATAHWSGPSIDSTEPIGRLLVIVAGVLVSVLHCMAAFRLEARTHILRRIQEWRHFENM